MPGTTPPDFGALLTPFINSVPASADYLDDLLTQLASH